MEMETNQYRFLRRICLRIDRLNSRIAGIASYVLVIMVLTVTYEVVCRYVFNSPTDWAFELNQYLLCVISMLGAGYTLLLDHHVRVDLLYRNFSLKRRAVAELATWWVAVFFFAVIVWRGSEMSYAALIEGKRSMGIMEFPLFPSMVMVPIGAFLLLLQALVRIVRNLLILKTGVDEVSLANPHHE